MNHTWDLRVLGGWIVVTYPSSLPELVPIYLHLGHDRYPAFLDFDADGTRIAKVRKPKQGLHRAVIDVEVNGNRYTAGKLSLASA